jgi:multiple sugar transport system substrate-binding protein
MRLRTALLAAGVWLGAAWAAQAADLTIWGLQTFNSQADQWLAQEAKDFGKTHNADVEYDVVPANVLNQRLAAAFEAHTPPDVFMQTDGSIQYYISRGLTIPLDDVLLDLRKVPGGIYENLTKAGEYNGTHQSLPLEVDVSPIFARKDLLDEIHRPLPTTWEELREDGILIQKKHPYISGFGMPVSNTNDAEGNLRSIIWSFGGKVMAPDGKTVVFDSPETRAAYQFVVDMFLKNKIIPHSALTWDDAGNNIAYQTGRAEFVLNPPSIYQYLRDHDKKLLAATVMISVPKGPSPHGINGNGVGSWQWAVAKDSKQPDLAKAYLRYFYDPAHYAAAIQEVGGRWVPIYPEMMKTVPVFARDPAVKEFGKMAATGILDGYAGPPNVLSGKVWQANILTKTLQKIILDHEPVAQAVAWGQQEIENLEKGS